MCVERIITKVQKETAVTIKSEVKSEVKSEISNEIDSIKISSVPNSTGVKVNNIWFDPSTGELVFDTE